MDADDYNRKQLEAGALTPRHVTQLVAAWQESVGLDADGKAGPRTIAALDAAARTPPRWERWPGPLPSIPRNRREVVAAFGTPGRGDVADPAWVAANVVECHESAGNRLPGVPGKWWVKVHRLAEPYLREGLRRAAVSAPGYRIERVGGFNYRHQRHDPSLPLSYHAWGIAVDVDPEHNSARTFPRGRCPAPWSREWMKLWPRGLPREFVEAMRSCGWTWGGDWNGGHEDVTFCDPQHFQLVAH